MTKDEFLNEAALIEKHVQSLVPEPETKNFFDCIHYFDTNKSMPEEILKALHLIWNTRNKLVNSVTGQSIELQKAELDAISQVKQFFNL